MNSIDDLQVYKENFIREYGDYNSSVFAQSHLMLIDNMIEVFEQFDKKIAPILRKYK